MDQTRRHFTPEHLPEQDIGVTIEDDLGEG